MDAEYRENIDLQVHQSNIRTYDIEKLCIIKTQRTSSAGFSIKYTTEDKKVFIKEQIFSEGVRLDDYVVEQIASDLMEALNIKHVTQKICRLKYSESEYRFGVESDNFEINGLAYVPFKNMLSNEDRWFYEDEYSYLEVYDKIDWIIDKYVSITQLNRDDIQKYILDLAIIDILVCNIDNHSRNFGIFLDINGNYIIPYIFDRGMGLFEWNSDKLKGYNYDMCMRWAGIQPYGEDPIELLTILNQKYDLSCYEFDKIKKNYGFDDYSRRYVESVFDCLKELGLCEAGII